MCIFVLFYLVKNNLFYSFEKIIFFIVKDDVMIREIDDANIKPNGKAKNKGTKKNMNDSGIGESFNVIIEFFK